MKIVSELLAPNRGNGHPAEWEHKDQTEGTSVVSAKDPPKIKLMNEKPLRTL